MKINRLIVFLLLIITSLQSYSQQDTAHYFYLKKDGSELPKPIYAFSVLQKQNIYTFIFKPDTAYATYPNKEVDTLITNKIYGPYKFRKKGNKIYFAMKTDSDTKWNYRELYILKSSESFLIPNLFSSTLDSYTTICKYIGSEKLVLNNNKSEPVYIFSEELKEGKKVFRRKTFISATTFLPLKIEYFSDTNNLDPSSTVYKMTL